MASSKPKLSAEERLARDVFARLAASTDEFEAYAHPHAERVAALSDALAKLFHLGRADRASLRLAALAHDLGEAAMKREYVRRAGALSAEERLDLARHPVIGEQEAARAGADRAAQLVVRWSHEWWNGAGYPDALRREQIPLAARILRVADSYCALTDDRPFRPAVTEEDARRHLAEWAGIEFDPRVVRAFLALHGLPELRSYARRDAETEDDALPTPREPAREAARRDESAPSPTMEEALIANDERRETASVARGDERSGGDADRSLGGYVPAMGANPYAPPGAGVESVAGDQSRGGDGGEGEGDLNEGGDGGVTR
ncbi:MAG: HD domain-containing protein [Acidobacteria bacterium]|nr:HD domain-containing protein [Acidobacteriota bacterium]MCA1643661.1 HD domain-containing protein [Acidobacteriota bacterium]